MTGFTGTKWFPNGLGSYTLPSLINEAGPTAPVTLQWASYYDAADQVGLSRIWGGIHPPADDIAGRFVGAEVGQTAWALAKKFFDGTVVNSEANIAMRKLDNNHVELRFNAVRSLHYTLQGATNPAGPYANVGTASQALEASIASTNLANEAHQFFRVSASLVP
jgi:hypothetical protein